MRLVFDNRPKPFARPWPIHRFIWAVRAHRNLVFWGDVEREPAPFEILEHPADVGFLAHGRTIEELFAHAALAMMSLGWELEGAGETLQREIHAEGEDLESLLYDWLSAILALADSERLILRRFEVNDLGRGAVRGTAWGERFDGSRHRARTYIKAVTLHQFQVRPSAEGWTARVFLDV